MKKLLFFFCAIIVVFCFRAVCSAIPVTFTYTADNIVDAWFLVDGAGTQQLADGTHYDNWQIANTATIELLDGHSYKIIWQCENSCPSNDHNPGGFLGEMTPSPYFTAASLLSSAQWEVAFVNSSTVPLDFDALNWSYATEYGNNGGANIWKSVKGSAITGISSSAQWIWTSLNFADSGAPTDNQSVYVKVTLNPVPEPSTFLLFGLGTLGFVGIIRRKKISQSKSLI